MGRVVPTGSGAQFFPASVPLRARLYLLTVTALGFAVFTYSAYLALAKLDWQWLSLAVLAFLASNLAVTLPSTQGKNHSVSAAMGDLFVFLAILYFGPAVAVVTAVAEGLAMNLRAKVGKAYKKIFNMSQLALTAFIASNLFYLTAGEAPPLSPEGAIPVTVLLVNIGVSAFSYFILNTGLVSLGMLLMTGGNPWHFWKENFAWTWVTQFGGACTALLAFYTLGDLTYAVLLGAPPLLLVYFAYKINLDRIKQTQQHLERTTQLLDDKIRAEEALQKAKEELEERVAKRTADLRRMNAQLIREIEERIHAEEALAGEKDRLAVTLKSISEGVITTDVEGRVVLVNEEAERLTGWKQYEAVGRPLGDVMVSFDLQKKKPLKALATQILNAEKDKAGVWEPVLLRSRRGQESIVLPSASPILSKTLTVGTVLVFRDITSQRKMEEEILKAQKMESLGILAGGIAHDFNNILAAILMKSELGYRALERGEPATEHFDSIRKAAREASSVTQQLLTFAKGGAPIKKTASLRELLEDATALCLRGRGTRAQFAIDEDLWSVSFDRGQISQVINNLVINAEQAMKGRGLLTIGARNFTLHKDDPVLKLGAGQYVCVRVQDEGEGISPENLERIFEPYFTTKPEGHGLGLASAYSVIKRHGGQLRVRSALGKGTTFQFYLPASPGLEPVAEVEDELPVQTGGRVLVMDDDDLIRESSLELLAELGYEAVGASDGEEACRLAERALKEGEAFPLVILDLTVPGGMGGKETILRLKKVDPRVRAIVSSGYSADSIMATPQQHGFDAVLTKPFTINSLAMALQAAHQSGGPAPAQKAASSR